MKKLVSALLVAMLATAINAQTGLRKVYNEDISPLEQIDQALVKAKAEGKFVICQVGGNWCPWCLRFADFIAKDTAISKVIEANFEYVHVNYNPRKSGGAEQAKQAAALMVRLENCGRFGFPVFVVLDEAGKVLHIQDSSFLEEGEGYDQKKVLRFFKNWTPSAIKNEAILAGTVQTEAQPLKTGKADEGNTGGLWMENGDRQIYGVLNRPLGREGRLPIAIVSHGFNGTHHFAQDYFEPLAELGWMTYAFDFPCGSVHSRSDANTMNMSVRDEQSDLRAIVNYFRRQPYVDPDRIMLIGESQGGLVSALTAAQMHKEVSHLVLIYPALCIPDNWNERYPREEDIPDTTLMWGVPMGRRYFEEVRTMDPFRTMKQFQKPVLIIQGDADPVVSMDDSRRAAKTYKDARLHVILGAGHGFKPTERQEAIEQIKQFITHQ